MKVKGFLLSVLLLLGCFGFMGCDDDFGILKVHLTWIIDAPKENVKVYLVHDYSREKELLKAQKDNSSDKSYYMVNYTHEVNTKKNYKANIELLFEYENEQEESLSVEFLIPYLSSKDGIQKKEFSYPYKNDTESLGILVNYYFSQTI